MPGPESCPHGRDLGTRCDDCAAAHARNKDVFSKFLGAVCRDCGGAKELGPLGKRFPCYACKGTGRVLTEVPAPVLAARTPDTIPDLPIGELIDLLQKVTAERDALQGQMAQLTTTLAETKRLVGRLSLSANTALRAVAIVRRRVTQGELLSHPPASLPELRAVLAELESYAEVLSELRFK